MRHASRQSNRVSNRLRSKLRRVLIALLVIGMLCKTGGMGNLVAGTWTGCFKTAIETIPASPCEGCSIIEYQGGDLNPVYLGECQGIMNNTIAYLKCDPVLTGGGNGHVQCSFNLLVVGLDYDCKKELDWTGIELYLTGLGVMTASCLSAILARSPRDIALCLASAGLLIPGALPCAWYTCVADSYVSSPIYRNKHTGMGGVPCPPQGESSVFHFPRSLSKSRSTALLKAI